MRVRVYRNLKFGRNTTPLYSVMDKATGRVIERRERVLLANAKFIVREGGRQRVLREGRKNVHAFVEGDLVDERGIFGQDEHGKDFPMRVTYNPYKAATFVTDGVLAGVPVLTAWGVLINERGISACYING